MHNTSALAATLLASCASGDEGTSQPTTAAAVEGETQAEGGADEATTEATPEHRKIELAVKDLGGREIAFAARGEIFDNWQNRDLVAESETGEALNDAVYKRNSAVEDKYNVKIVGYKLDNPMGAVQKSVKAADGQYDIFNGVLTDTMTLVQEGSVIDLTNQAGLNVRNPWWDQKAVDGLAINGKLYTLMGDAIVGDDRATQITLFNKKILKDYNLDDPYASVKAGKWTIDQFYSLAKAATKDLDGDGVLGEMDQWGYVTEYNLVYGTVASSGEKMVTIGANGDMEITINTPRIVTVFDKVFEVMTDPNTTQFAEKYLGKYSNPWLEVNVKSFQEDRALFYSCSFNAVPYFREMDTDFGILPIPKYNEEQENYYSSVQYGNLTPISILKTDKNMEDLMMVLESMGQESVDTVTVAYYDINLRTKIARDEDSKEMIDIIFDNRVFDMGPLFRWANGTEFFAEIVKSGNNTYVSKAESVIGKIETAMAKSLEKLQ